MLDQQEINSRDFHQQMVALQPARRWKQADRRREEKAVGSACWQREIAENMEF